MLHACIPHAILVQWLSWPAQHQMCLKLLGCHALKAEVARLVRLSSSGAPCSNPSSSHTHALTHLVCRSCLADLSKALGEVDHGSQVLLQGLEVCKIGRASSERWVGGWVGSATRAMNTEALLDLDPGDEHRGSLGSRSGGSVAHDRTRILFWGPSKSHQIAAHTRDSNGPPP